MRLTMSSHLSNKIPDNPQTAVVVHQDEFVATSLYGFLKYRFRDEWTSIQIKNARFRGRLFLTMFGSLPEAGFDLADRVLVAAGGGHRKARGRLARGGGAGLLRPAGLAPQHSLFPRQEL